MLHLRYLELQAFVCCRKSCVSPADVSRTQRRGQHPVRRGLASCCGLCCMHRVANLLPAGPVTPMPACLPAPWRGLCLSVASDFLACLQYSLQLATSESISPQPAGKCSCAGPPGRCTALPQHCSLILAGPMLPAVSPHATDPSYLACCSRCPTSCLAKRLPRCNNTHHQSAPLGPSRGLLYQSPFTGQSPQTCA